MDEPPVLLVLNVLCHNELLRAEGQDKKYSARVSFFQRLLAPFVDINEQSIATYKEIEEARGQKSAGSTQMAG